MNNHRNGVLFKHVLSSPFLQFSKFEPKINIYIIQEKKIKFQDIDLGFLSDFEKQIRKSGRCKMFQVRILGRGSS